MGFGIRNAVCPALAGSGDWIWDGFCACGISGILVCEEAVRDWWGVCGSRYGSTCDRILFGIMKKASF